MHGMLFNGRRLRRIAFACTLASALTSALTVPGAAGAADEPQRSVLFLTHSAGFKHASLAVAESVFLEIGRHSGAYRGVVLEGYKQPPDAIDLSIITPEYLEQFDAVMFFTTGELPLDDEQKAALLSFVRGGKAWIGVHSATDTFYDWPAYAELSGGYFLKHGPANREAVIAIEDTNHPATKMLGPSWTITDEIYQFATKPGDRRRPVALSRDNVRVLMSVDKQRTDLAAHKMSADGDYPLAWTRQLGKGRCFYTALGHRDDVWRDPTFQAHLLGGIRWALGLDTDAPAAANSGAAHNAAHATGADPGAGEAGGTPAGSAHSGAGGCRPLETREANVPEQRPIFPEQTRACAAASSVAFDVVVLAKGLEHPWAVEPLANGDLLVTERPGRMRIVTADGKTGEPIAGVPAVDARGQGGLLDVELSPTFDSDRTIYWSYAEPREGGNATSIARGVLSEDRETLEQVEVIFRALPTYEGDKHFGSRLVFSPDGMLYVTLGERSDAHMRRLAQQLDNHMGKTLRLKPDGTAPRDNPFVDSLGAMPEIWTLGHRNVQSAALDGKGRLWEVEHGARGGDELNLIVKGKNYGWPLVAWGEEYSGQPIPGAVAGERVGFEPPVYYWDPVIAPSGAQFYTGDAFPEWRDSLFVGSLIDRCLVRLTLENDRVTGEERLLAERGQRVRDVRQGRDGALYVVTDEPIGEVWKIAPRP